MIVTGALGIATAILAAVPDAAGRGPGRAGAVATVAALAAAAALVTSVARYRAVRTPSWLFLAAGAGTWSIGQAGRTAWTFVHPGTPMPFPSWADGTLVLAAPLMAVGLLVLRTDVVPVTRARRVVDAGIMAASLLFVSWASVLGPAFYRAGDGATARGLAVAYLSGGVVAISLAVSFLARLRSGRTTMAWLAAGLVVMTAADWAYLYRSTGDGFRPGSWLSVAWTAAFLLFMLGALSPRRRARSEQVASPGGAMLVLPLLPVLTVVGVAVAQLGRGERPGPLLAVTAFVIVVLLVVRQYLTALENRMLTHRLAERIEELSDREHELRHQAFHDPLTGLANRALFLDRIEHALTLRGDRRLAILFIDIDDFKLVNDSFGHSAGDDLITAIGQRLQAVCRHGDTVARLGGDEFGILLEGLARRDDAGIIAGRLIEAVRSPLSIGGVSLSTRASIGVAHTEEAHTPGELLRNADVALYAAKSEGKGSWRVFAPSMQAEAREKLDLEAELTRAVETGEIDVAFQPMVRLETGALAGFEALARWRHDRRGAISPATFIGLAEEMGLIHSLGVAVLRRACEQARAWGDRYPDAPPWWMTVNVSARQLVQPDLVTEVRQVLDETGLAPDRLILEITETSLLSDADVVLSRLHELRERGIRLALDDFGTGYASLDYLRRLPVEVLKIDRIFVEAATSDPSSARLLQAVVNIGATLGLETLAEGVEDAGQAGLLAAMNCDLAQGFHFARPAPAPEIDRLLTRLSSHGWRFDDGPGIVPPVAWDRALSVPRGSTA